jgi:hypothetical protein
MMPQAIAQISRLGMLRAMDYALSNASGQTIRPKGAAMNFVRTIFATAVLLAILAPLARGDDASHRAAVTKLFDTMHMKELLDSSMVQMTDMQIKANPEIAPFRQILLDFVSKYMNWDALAPDMTKLYMETFTEQEIKELEKFYATPTGQKAVKTMPELMTKGGEIGQKRVQEHIGELQQAIQAEAMKRGQK